MWSAATVATLIEGLASARRRSPHTISTLVTGSGDMYARLTRGCDLTSRRAARIAQQVSDHWPVDLPWPAEIPRPRPSPDSPAAAPAAAPLAAALELGPSGRIRSPRALCESLGVSRATYDDAVRRYADGRSYGDREPQKRSDGAVNWTTMIVDALVESGDVRFARRREQRRKHAKLACRLGLGAA